jgi:hypothetical protein
VAYRNSDGSQLDTLAIYDLMVSTARHWRHSESVEPTIEYVQQVLALPYTWLCTDAVDVPVGVATISPRLEGLSADVHMLCKPAYLRNFSKWIAKTGLESHRVLKLELYGNQKQAIALAGRMGFVRIGVDSHSAYALDANGQPNTKKPLARILLELKRHAWKLNTWSKANEPNQNAA